MTRIYYGAIQKETYTDLWIECFACEADNANVDVVSVNSFLNALFFKLSNNW